MKTDFEAWLDAYPPDEKHLAAKVDKQELTHKAAACRQVLDLHGLTREQARLAVDQALKAALQDQVASLLIIHGKGLHSSTGPVLATWLRDYLEGHSLAGKIQSVPAKQGGTGALEVSVRKKN